jgi:hypothetical protein
MRTLILAVAALVSAAPAAHAEPAVAHEEWVELGSTRFVPILGAVEREAIAAYGPFRVLDANTAAVVDVTDEASPAEFQTMLRDYPQLATLRFVDCPGTYDDRANLAVGRLIRAAGLMTEVPAGGSVRSGGVELVLAGVEQEIDDRAEFAVHAWLDEDGREAGDYGSESPEHRKYLAYYRDMGLEDAEAFYAMTNSVPFEDALWLSGSEMRRWLVGTERSAPKLAYPDLAHLDLEAALH